MENFYGEEEKRSVSSCPLPCPSVQNIKVSAKGNVFIFFFKKLNTSGIRSLETNKKALKPRFTRL